MKLTLYSCQYKQWIWMLKQRASITVSCLIALVCALFLSLMIRYYYTLTIARKAAICFMKNRYVCQSRASRYNRNYIAQQRWNLVFIFSATSIIVIEIFTPQVVNLLFYWYKAHVFSLCNGKSLSLKHSHRILFYFWFVCVTHSIYQEVL